MHIFVVLTVMQCHTTLIFARDKDREESLFAPPLTTSRQLTVTSLTHMSK